MTMREDLIERLQLKRDVWRGTEFGDDICELLEEAAAALEAAREDAERVVFLVPGGRDEPNDADLIEGYRRMIDSARGIYQARGKGVA